MIQDYIEYIYPGILIGETVSEKCGPDKRLFPERVKLPENALGFRFYQRVEIPIDGVAVKTTASSPPINSTEWYFYGHEMTFAEVEYLAREFPEYYTAASNMRINNINRCVKFRNGQMFFLHENDKVIGSDTCSKS